jgi:hypothetical protein
MNIHIPSEQEIKKLTGEAVKFFWETREKQMNKQASGKDTGNRGAVTGGKQMDGFADMLTNLLSKVGISNHEVFTSEKPHLPGYFRATKKWDFLVVKTNDRGEKYLLAAVELKSHVGPSFGNNLNNRVEESLGSATDIWIAFREKAFKNSRMPWLGYLMLLEDCPASTRPVKVDEPHFEVFPEFKNASYAKRYELFCRKIVLERKYTSSCLLMSDKQGGLQGIYKEPANDLKIYPFLFSLLTHVAAEAELISSS